MMKGWWRLDETTEKTKFLLFRRNLWLTKELYCKCIVTCEEKVFVTYTVKAFCHNGAIEMYVFFIALNYLYGLQCGECAFSGHNH